MTAQWLIDILYVLSIDLDEERELTQEELRQILEAELDQMRNDLGDAESYEDLLDLTDGIDDFWSGHDDIFNYDTGDSAGYDDIGSNISDTSGRISGSTGGSKVRPCIEPAPEQLLITASTGVSTGLPIIDCRLCRA